MLVSWYTVFTDQQAHNVKYVFENITIGTAKLHRLSICIRCNSMQKGKR